MKNAEKSKKYCHLVATGKINSGDHGASKFATVAFSESPRAAERF